MAEVLVKPPHGAPFLFHVHDHEDVHISTTLRRAGKWEPYTTRILSGLLRQGDGVLDIGANIGWYSAVLGRRVGTEGFVHAFEPDRNNADVLERNCRHLMQVCVHQFALADRNGCGELSLSEDNLGDHRLNASGSRGARRTVTVRTQTLDNFVLESGLDVAQLRVVKMDTQGAESLILRGARTVLQRLPGRCALLVEFAPNLLRKQGEAHIEEFVATLSGLGRHMFVVRRASLARSSAAHLHKVARKLAPLGDEWAVDVLIAPQPKEDLRRLRLLRIPRPTRFV